MMYLAVVIASLTATYCLTLASFAWEDIALGLILSATLVTLYRKTVFPSSLPVAGYVLRIVLHSPRFLLMVIVDVLKGTWQVATYVVGLRKLEHPGIVRIPLAGHSPTGVGLVGLLVTLSPGSFLVDIDWEERSMLVHYIDASDPERLRRDVEKYYRLWEYGAPAPGGSGDSGFQQESG